MKKIGFVTVLIFAGIQIVFAQMNYQSAYKIKQAVDFFNFNKTQTDRPFAALTEADIKGSPFLNEEFAEGSVFTTSKTQFVSVPLRYNIFNDKIEFRGDDGRAYEIGVPEVIEKVEFGEYKMEYLPYLTSKKLKRGFFMILEKGYASLYSKPRVIFEEAKNPGAYQDAQPAMFISRPEEYYIKVGMEAAKPIYKSKDLAEVFPDHQKEVLSFLKKNKLRHNNPDNLKELVQFYNSL
jgi:hypothetical protein